MAKILVIEDHGPLGRLFQAVLGQNGHEVILAESGEAGVATVAQKRPDPVIMDLVLPGMSGLEAAHKIQEAGSLSGTPLIITTALTEDHAKRVAASLDATSVLVKPFDINEMFNLGSEGFAKPGGQFTSPVGPRISSSSQLPGSPQTASNCTISPHGVPPLPI